MKRPLSLQALPALFVCTFATLALGGCEVRTFDLKSDGGGRPNPGDTDGGYNPFAGGANGGGGSGGGGSGSMDAREIPDGFVPLADGGLCKIERELCDGLDNDCDGIIDNGFDLTKDPGNCGACGKICVVTHAFASCVQGTCGVADCLPGWFDVDKKLENGCECLRSNGGVELCDGADNDCDGLVDEDFAFKTDLNNCGVCGKSCDYPNAAATCSDGACQMGACNAGRIDLNKKAEDGCEYECTVSNSGTEICDGQDNDCDGGIDNSPVDQGGACGPDVVNVGVCTRGVLTCTSGRLVCLGAKEPGIEVCDGRDNNCDGSVDEGFNKLSDIRYCGNCEPCSFQNAVPKCVTGMCQLEVCSPGFVDLNTTQGDGCEYQCTFRGQDVCNGADDDCDGMTDEGINKATDPRNCGGCGTICSYANAVGVCSNSQCSLGGCNANFYDIDGNATTGCEYFCVNSGAETCDGVDNDCDGMTDEGFTVATDANNCGQCGRQCQFANAGAMCSNGQCAMGTCSAGYTNANNNTADGCEYQCTPSNGGTEICDGKDNDCDGLIDESDPQDGKNCYPDATVGCDPAAGTCKGICVLGKYKCLGGQLACQNYQTPRPETCDNVDNNCDGTTDDGFDKTSDPRFCGSCGTSCSFSNAVALCQTSQCTLGPCKTGWVNQDGNAANGCEYNCTPTGPEVCDGKDNDCDKLTDEADPDILRPANFCLQLGECGNVAGGAKPQCLSASVGEVPDWICSYNANVQQTAPNEIIGQESWCDGKDNDCDGATDEFVATKGTSCSDSGVGACQRTGTIGCDPADKTAAASCQYSGPAPSASNEVCDGADNDCDGITDEAWDNPSGLTKCGSSDCQGVRDAVVNVNVGGKNYYIYQYEASRQDAKTADVGVLGSRACSKASALPWTSVTYTEAQTACAAAGMRLCRSNRTASACGGNITVDEWGFACEYTRAGAETYPYGTTYQSATCNGLESWSNQANAAASASGAKTACKTADLGSENGEQAVFDMSGNVSEWTEDCPGTLSGRNIYTIRGGDFTSDYYNGISSLRCNFTAVGVPLDYKHPSTGFRCCSVCAPGTSECNGACVNFANNASNCGACGNVCGSGTTCTNGQCK
ncbi:MAG: MopE-related protein [Deltaproteobacteria bacterium]|nr:MopE-related protein [Deltaproteobacteria bacterium]